LQISRVTQWLKPDQRKMMTCSTGFKGLLFVRTKFFARLENPAEIQRQPITSLKSLVLAILKDLLEHSEARENVYPSRGMFSTNPAPDSLFPMPQYLLWHKTKSAGAPARMSAAFSNKRRRVRRCQNDVTKIMQGASLRAPVVWKVCLFID